ncbi:MAG: hypothetical protein FJ125_05155, partial [Deltaproteobacteria bacterium]|nr:hypothetical protein [Deltaproteobacteria bacterium]
AAESCNYQDDDCDGLTDEGFVDEASGLYVHPEHCGRCGISCAGAVPYASETACAVEDGAAACVALQCEPDYFVPPETSRICLPRAGGFDCSPCLADEHCSTLADGRCEGLAEGEGRFCTRSCSLDEDCPAGFGCNAQQRCHPSSGSCTCLPERAGVSRLCRWENEQGTCLGRELCDPLLGWSDCSAHLPAAEECNGIDDDCDFLVDEELLPPDGPLCTVAGQWGVCTGPWSCAGEAGWQCGAAIPAAEQCNGRDDDCDGTTDEGFRNPQTGLYDSVDHCGVCGYSCTGRIPHAAALRCDVAGGLPTCAVVSCEPGFFRAGDLACVPVTSNRCVPCIDDGSCPVDGDRCLELDGARVCGQDCRAGNLHGLAAGVCPQGYTCRGFGVEVRQCVPISGSCTCLAEHAGSSRLCTVANELGRCTGFATCDPERSWSGCSAPPPARESCNGRDDDCDGMIDEGFAGLNQPCLAGEGACLRAGVMRCTDDGAATICGAQPGAAQPEACNYQDDDCDGATDEDYKDPLTGLYVGQEHCGLCNASCARAILFATATECRVVGASALCLATACEPGYLLSQNGRVCVPPSGVGDCSPCAEDIDCMSMAGGRCERFPEGRFCTKGCGGEAGGCSPGYDCVAGRCWPVSRSCTCLLGNAGEMRVCWSSNAAGTCVGTQTCAPERSPGWQPCTAPVPAVETCDGQDNDCNGLTDEGVVHPDGPACLRRNELGACPGVWLCRGIERWSCSAAEPVVESCNGKDDDCDGVVDEDFPALLVPCFAGEGACRVAGVARCTPDGRGTECTARAGQPTPELCNGVDDDCDRRVDEDFPDLFTPCSAGQGVCLRQGVRVCTQDGRGTECDARPGQAGVESCNGLDDDCNGLIDDGYPGLGMPCSAGIGACQRPGVLVCAAGGQGTVCNAVTGEPREERCNGVDDDCDGGVDEDFGNLARACSVGVGACLRQGVQVCTDDGLGTKCDAMPGMAGEESCNGLDDDCDGRIDEDFADLFTPCIVGQGACQNAGVRVCTLDGHATECDAEPRPAGEEICDSLDNDCDGWTDEEFDGLAAPCMVGDGACRRVGIVRCAADHQGTECSVQPGQPVAERCNGIDDDCDQQTDEEAIWAAKGQPCTAGVGACARSGIHVCNQDDPAGPTVCTAQAGAAGQERCNGV